MDSVMYPGIEYLHYVGKLETNRPFFVCEYAHSMGNATGNLDEYVEAFEAHPRLIGGCIWDFVDQGLRTRTPTARKGLMAKITSSLTAVTTATNRTTTTSV